MDIQKVLLPVCAEGLARHNKFLSYHFLRTERIKNPLYSLLGSLSAGKMPFWCILLPFYKKCKKLNHYITQIHVSFRPCYMHVYIYIFK
ncbi:hypothetical protein GDO81_003486 [Engystomops pustulosus]|uniref:Uncharacterized protein n=1 Tax=Engystomops pustulosus TaxID=76066 RepID=A0AAV7A3R8_ENGPU|nr:hypothetical protein GDO81_003486 [Engystomops pustulosus]